MTANEVLKKIEDEAAYLEYSLTMAIDEIRIPRIGKVVVLAQELKKFYESLTERYESPSTPLPNSWSGLDADDIWQITEQLCNLTGLLTEVNSDAFGTTSFEERSKNLALVKLLTLSSTHLMQITTELFG